MGAATEALDDCEFMDALLNVVLPASPDGEIPAAGTLGLSAEVAQGIRKDTLLGPAVGPGLDALRDAARRNAPGGLPAMSGEHAAEFVKAQFAANPMLMMGLLRHLYPAYYAHPDVLRGIGEPSRPAFPEGFQVEPTDAALLERLKARAIKPAR